MNKIIFGLHSIRTLLECDSDRFEKVFVIKTRSNSNQRLELLINKLKSRNIIIQYVNSQWLDHYVGHSLHQGIIAHIAEPINYRECDLPSFIQSKKEPFLLILDCITDPHNLGACLRSADAAGVHAVIVPKDRSVYLNDTVKKVACGAAENIPLIRVTNLARTIRLLKEFNIWIVGTTNLTNNIIYNSKLKGALALVMGSEGKGIRRLTLRECNELISIPMFGCVSSLNVSVATGICLFEAIRQRLV